MSIPAVTIPALSDQTLWLTVASIGVVVLYLIMRPRKRKDPLSRPPTFPLIRQRDVEEQMSNLIVELAAMARQITGQLDTRAAKLELLIQEADQKIAALEAANHAAAKGVDFKELAALAEPRPPTLPPAENPVETRHGEIYGMADEGRSASEIAKCLNRPAGEIELILALRRR